MDAILEPLLNSPRLFDYLAELQDFARAEREKREWFYAEVTPEKKWEFINGEVVMHSPATIKHTEIRSRIESLLTAFARVQKVGWAGGERVLICLTRNDYDPDVLFFGPAKAAGLRPDQLQMPAPDLAIEILSPSTKSNDRGVKFRDYAAHGVAEYWIVDPVDESIEQYFIGPDGAYTLHAKQVDGAIHSRAVDGWVMPVRAAFDDAENLTALRALLG
jgi:Uma2 family endonuclease